MKTVIAGLEEGLNAIADALEGGGGGGSIVPTPAAADEGKVLTANDDGTASWEDAGSGIPTPTLDDEGKVLKAVPQTQTTVAPEWATIRELPIGGREGQVLTRSHEGYEWETPNGLPALYDEDNGKVLMAQYDSDTENTYPAWSILKGVPNSNASDAGKVLTCAGRNAYGWAPASGGGGHIDVIKFTIAKSEFTQDGSVYKAYINGSYPNLSTKIDNMISISIVDNVDSGSPTFTIPSNDDDCSIYMNGDDGMVSISSAIYGTLGSRQAINFYLTYYA